MKEVIFLKRRFCKDQEQEQDLAMQHKAQEISNKFGVTLTSKQMKQYLQYCSDSQYSKTPEHAIIYMVLTPAQRIVFDYKRYY